MIVTGVPIRYPANTYFHVAAPPLQLRPYAAASVRWSGKMVPVARPSPGMMYVDSAVHKCRYVRL